MLLPIIFLLGMASGAFFACMHYGWKLSIAHEQSAERVNALLRRLQQILG